MSGYFREGIRRFDFWFKFFYLEEKPMEVKMRKILILIWLILVSQRGGFIFAQSDDLQLDTYQQFLLDHMYLTTSGLTDLYPVSYFKSKVSQNNSTLLYLDYK